MPVLSLPSRGARVDTNRGAELRADLNPQEVVQRIDNLIDREQVRLTDMPALRSLPSSIVSENDKASSLAAKMPGSTSTTNLKRRTI